MELSNFEARALKAEKIANELKERCALLEEFLLQKKQDTDVEVNATSKNNHLASLIPTKGSIRPPEVKHDVFDRQRVIEGWNQKRLEDQVCFVLGVGGIGSTVAIALARLGVKKMFLLDRDVVDASNLNRQILFTKYDVGKKKALAAARNLETHNLRTEIVPLDIDAVVEWAKVVEIASQCTVLFNNIDYAAIFDMAVNSLSKKLGIPYVAGSTYSNTVELALYTGRPQDACWRCVSSTQEMFQYSPDEIKAYGSNFDREGILHFLGNALHSTGPVTEKIVDKVLAEKKLEKKTLNIDELSKLLPHLKPEVEAELVPHKIIQLKNISFIPKAKSFPTRTIGSWIGVCSGGSLLIVNRWIQWLMSDSAPSREEQKPLHNWSRVDISLELGGVEAFSYANELDPQCLVCNDLKGTKKEVSKEIKLESKETKKEVSKETKSESASEVKHNVLLRDAETDGGSNPLKESEAHFRSKQVGNVSYELHIELRQNVDQYNGEIHVRFNYTPQSEAKELFLEHIGKEILKLSLNGIPQEKLTEKVIWKHHRLYLPINALKETDNDLHIVYINNYDHTGAGFHQFKDPEDSNEYLYTNFEPYECRRLLPCFDQPSIKAKYTLTVTAPSVWEVIGNSPHEKVTSQDDKKVWSFRQTKPFSTYLFALIAGPFESFSDTYDNGRIPLRYLSRKTLKKLLEPDITELFTITKNGFKFYEEFFGVAYPFEKYDQLFVPEFNEGAMENVGAVTFSEAFIYRDKPTRSKRCDRSDTVLHEMAHMWFGNLVTPVWWDGLWLNESFATYMAALATSEATEFGALSWQNFFASIKTWAMREDQLSTTHPIQGKVLHTDQTFLNFDGITYGKGASLIKQLVYVIGPKGFAEGMRLYFKKYSWGNTTIHDFLSALEHGSGASDVFNAKDWSKQWLETSGLNTLTPKVQIQKASGGKGKKKKSKDSKIKTFTITQTHPPEHPHLRKQFVEIGLFDKKDNKTVSSTKSFKVEILAEETTTVSELKNKKPPAFTFINYRDHGFAKVFFDPTSEKFASENLEKFDDNLLRLMLWDTFYQMVRDARYHTTHYFQLTQEKLRFESDSKLIQSILGRAAGSIVFLSDKVYQEEAEKLFGFIHELAKEAKEEEWSIIYCKALIDVAASKKTVIELLPYLEEGRNVGNFALDQGMRWRVVQRAVSWNLEGANELLEKEAKRDPSDRGEREALTGRSALFDLKIKEAAWERYLDKSLEQKLSMHKIIADMSGFRWRHQQEILHPKFTDLFFKVIREVVKTRSKEFSTNFYRSLFPFYPEDSSISTRANEILDQLTEEEVILKKLIKESLDDLSRAKKARNFRVKDKD